MNEAGDGAGTASLLDRFLPRYQVSERHTIIVSAALDDVHRAVVDTDLAEHPVVRGLLLARALPAALFARRLKVRWEDARAPLTLRDFCRFGFVELVDDPPHAIALGLTGRFWQPGGGLVRTDRDSFATDQPAGTARAGWSFTLEPIDAQHTRLSTETRVRCTDARSRRLFAAYWLLVGPASGLIRRMMLRAIRRRAESTVRRQSAA